MISDNYPEVVLSTFRNNDIVLNKTEYILYTSQIINDYFIYLFNMIF